ncbi:MAG: YraN family protein [Eubacteriales bacterium]
MGAWGEAQAGEYLRKQGYQLVACNYKCRFGEIDLIVKNRKFIVFVEVKLRKTDAFGQAREFVTAKKQERVRTTAMVWLQTNDTGLQPRFDVIEVYAPRGTDTKKPQIIHLENAFE